MAINDDSNENHITAKNNPLSDSINGERRQYDQPVKDNKTIATITTPLGNSKRFSDGIWELKNTSPAITLSQSETQVREDVNIFNIYTSILKELKLDLKSLLTQSCIDQGKGNTIVRLINLCFYVEEPPAACKSSISAYTQKLAKDCVKIIEKVVYRQTDVVIQIDKIYDDCSRKSLKRILLKFMLDVEKELIISHSRDVDVIHANLQRSTFKFIYCFLKYFIEEIVARLNLGVNQDHVNRDGFASHGSALTPKKPSPRTSQPTRKKNLDEYSYRLDKLIQKWAGKENSMRSFEKSDVVIDCYHCLTGCEKQENFKHISQQTHREITREHVSCRPRMNPHNNFSSVFQQEALKVHEISNTGIRTQGRTTISSWTVTGREQPPYMCRNGPQRYHKDPCATPALTANQNRCRKFSGNDDLLLQKALQPVSKRCEQWLDTCSSQTWESSEDSFNIGNCGRNYGNETCRLLKRGRIENEAGGKSNNYEYLVICESNCSSRDSAIQAKLISEDFQTCPKLDHSVQVQAVYDIERTNELGVDNTSKNPEMGDEKNEELSSKTKGEKNQKKQSKKKESIKPKRVSREESKKANRDKNSNDTSTKDDGENNDKSKKERASNVSKPDTTNQANQSKKNNENFDKVESSGKPGEKSIDVIKTQAEPVRKANVEEKNRPVSRVSANREGTPTQQESVDDRKTQNTEPSTKNEKNTKNGNEQDHCVCCKCSESKGNDNASSLYFSPCHCNQSSGQDSNNLSNRPIYQFFANSLVPIPCNCAKSKEKEMAQSKHPTPYSSSMSTRKRDSQDMQTQTSKCVNIVDPTESSMYSASKDHQNCDPSDKRGSLDMETQTSRPCNKDASTPNSKCDCTNNIEDVFQEFDDNYSKVVQEIKLLIREGCVPRCPSSAEHCTSTRGINITTWKSAAQACNCQNTTSSKDKREPDERSEKQPYNPSEKYEPDNSSKQSRANRPTKNDDSYYQAPDLQKEIEELKRLVKNKRMGACPCCKCCECDDGSKARNSKMKVKEQSPPQYYSDDDLCGPSESQVKRSTDKPEPTEVGRTKNPTSAGYANSKRPTDQKESPKKVIQKKSLENDVTDGRSEILEKVEANKKASKDTSGSRRPNKVEQKRSLGKNETDERPYKDESDSQGPKKVGQKKSLDNNETDERPYKNESDSRRPKKVEQKRSLGKDDERPYNDESGSQRPKKVGQKKSLNNDETDGRPYTDRSDSRGPKKVGQEKSLGNDETDERPYKNESDSRGPKKVNQKKSLDNDETDERPYKNESDSRGPKKVNQKKSLDNAETDERPYKNESDSRGPKKVNQKKSLDNGETDERPYNGESDSRGPKKVIQRKSLNNDDTNKRPYNRESDARGSTHGENDPKQVERINQDAQRNQSHEERQSTSKKRDAVEKAKYDGQEKLQIDDPDTSDTFDILVSNEPQFAGAEKDSRNTPGKVFPSKQSLVTKDSEPLSGETSEQERSLGILELENTDSSLSAYNESERNSRKSGSSREERRKRDVPVMEEVASRSISYGKPTPENKMVSITKLYDDGEDNGGNAIAPERRALVESRENLFRPWDVDEFEKPISGSAGRPKAKEGVKRYSEEQRSALEKSSDSYDSIFSSRERDFGQRQEQRRNITGVDGKLPKSSEPSASDNYQTGRDAPIDRFGDDATVASEFSSCDFDDQLSDSVHSSSSTVSDECRELFDRMPCSLYSDESCISSTNEIIKATKTELYVMIIESQKPTSEATNKDDEIISLLLSGNNDQTVTKKLPNHKNLTNFNSNDHLLTSDIRKSIKTQKHQTSTITQKLLSSIPKQSSYETISVISDIKITTSTESEKTSRTRDLRSSKTFTNLLNLSRLKLKKMKENRKEKRRSKGSQSQSPKVSEDKEVQVTKWNATVQTAGPKKFNRVDIPKEVEDRLATYLGLERTAEQVQAPKVQGTSQITSSKGHTSRKSRSSVSRRKK